MLKINILPDFTSLQLSMNKWSSLSWCWYSSTSTFLQPRTVSIRLLCFLPSTGWILEKPFARFSDIASSCFRCFVSKRIFRIWTVILPSTSCLRVVSKRDIAVAYRNWQLLSTFSSVLSLNNFPIRRNKTLY